MNCIADSDAPASREPLCVLAGPTAVGKTAVSLPLALAMGAEILAVDSRQIFRGMEIGSAAPTSTERARVPHHLVGEVEPEVGMSAGAFGRLFAGRLEALRTRGVPALVVGGSGLYLRAALGGLDEGLPQDAALRALLRQRVQSEGAPALHAELALLDPVSAARISPRDAQRITRALEICRLAGQPASALRKLGRKTIIPVRIVVIDREREDLEARIRARVRDMVDAGLEREVRALLDRGLNPGAPVLRSVGYAETIRYLSGEMDREAWMEAIVVNTRRFAKRQRTWFRSLTGAVWLHVDPAEDPETTAHRVEDVFV